MWDLAFVAVHPSTPIFIESIALSPSLRAYLPKRPANANVHVTSYCMVGNVLTHLCSASLESINQRRFVRDLHAAIFLSGVTDSPSILRHIVPRLWFLSLRVTTPATSIAVTAAAL